MCSRHRDANGADSIDEPPAGIPESQRASERAHLLALDPGDPLRLAAVARLEAAWDELNAAAYAAGSPVDELWIRNRPWRERAMLLLGRIELERCDVLELTRRLARPTS